MTNESACTEYTDKKTRTIQHRKVLNHHGKICSWQTLSSTLSSPPHEGGPGPNVKNGHMPPIGQKNALPIVIQWLMLGSTPPPGGGEASQYTFLANSNLAQRAHKRIRNSLRQSVLRQVNHACRICHLFPLQWHKSSKQKHNSSSAPS